MQGQDKLCSAQSILALHIYLHHSHHHHHHWHHSTHHDQWSSTMVMIVINIKSEYVYELNDKIKQPKLIVWNKWQSPTWSEFDECIWIFKYSKIYVTNIYLDICSYWFFRYKYIRILIRIVFLILTYSDIYSYQNHILAECDEYLNIQISVSFSIRIFIRIIFL